MDLFTGFRRGAESRAARANQSAAEASLVDARFQQALTTTNQFLDALAAQQLVRVRETSVRRAEEQLKTAVAKLRAGSATRSDSLRSLVTLGSARLELIRAGTDLATAEAGLARLIGETGRVRATDDSAFYRVMTVARHGRAPGRGGVEEPPDPERQRQRRCRPSGPQGVALGLLAHSVPVRQHGLERQPYNDYDLFNQRQLNLGLRWNLFDGFDRELAIAQRSASADVADATAADEQRAVGAELTARLAELEAAGTQIEITQTSVVAATEDLRVQQERYRLGASTIVDVLTSQEALNQAEVDVVVARFDYLRAKAQLEALIGRTL